MTSSGIQDLLADVETHLRTEGGVCFAPWDGLGGETATTVVAVVYPPSAGMPSVAFVRPGLEQGLHLITLQTIKRMLERFARGDTAVFQSWDTTHDCRMAIIHAERTARHERGL